MSDTAVSIIGKVVGTPLLAQTVAGDTKTTFAIAPQIAPPPGRTSSTSSRPRDVQAFGKLGALIASYVRDGGYLWVRGHVVRGKGAAHRSKPTPVTVDQVIFLGDPAKHRPSAPHSGPYDQDI